MPRNSEHDAVSEPMTDQELGNVRAAVDGSERNSEWLRVRLLAIIDELAEIRRLRSPAPPEAAGERVTDAERIAELETALRRAVELLAEAGPKRFDDSLGARVPDVRWNKKLFAHFRRILGDKAAR